MTFKDLLSDCWDDWETDPLPKDRRMHILNERGVGGMSTENVRFLINEIVRRYAGSGTYLEVGTYLGCSLLSAALFNPCATCIGIDSFQYHNPDATNEQKMHENLSKFPEVQNIVFHKQDYRRGFYGALEGSLADVYFYDGAHNYEDQLMGMEMGAPWLAPKCLMIVDDAKWAQVQNAIGKFKERNPAFKTLFSVLPETNELWWNGIEVMGRNLQ